MEISDFTRTVYISFVARAAANSERLQLVVRKMQRFSFLSFSDYPTITPWKFQDGQIAMSLTHYY